MVQTRPTETLSLDIGVQHNRTDASHSFRFPRTCEYSTKNWVKTRSKGQNPEWDPVGHVIEAMSTSYSLSKVRTNFISVFFGDFFHRFWRVQNTIRRNYSSTAGPASGCSVRSANWDASTRDIKSCRWLTRTRPWRWESHSGLTIRLQIKYNKKNRT